MYLCRLAFWEWQRGEADREEVRGGREAAKHGFLVIEHAWLICRCPSLLLLIM